MNRPERTSDRASAAVQRNSSRTSAVNGAGAGGGSSPYPQQQPQRQPSRPPLYTPAERIRRDSSVWTLVQGILAPVQFLVFLASVALVLRYLSSGEGLGLATASVVVKTLVLYTIMITGCIWEKVVFDRWLFAPAFFWEDVFSMLVLALHTAYLWAFFTDALPPRGLMLLALAAYATYAVNAAQFIWKLRLARLDEAVRKGSAAASGGGEVVA